MVTSTHGKGSDPGPTSSLGEELPSWLKTRSHTCSGPAPGKLTLSSCAALLPPSTSACPLNRVSLPVSRTPARQALELFQDGDAQQVSNIGTPLHTHTRCVSSCICVHSHWRLSRLDRFQNLAFGQEVLCHLILLTGSGHEKFIERTKERARTPSTPQEEHQVGRPRASSGEQSRSSGLLVVSGVDGGKSAEPHLCPSSAPLPTPLPPPVSPRYSPREPPAVSWGAGGPDRWTPRTAQLPALPSPPQAGLPSRYPAPLGRW